MLPVNKACRLTIRRRECFKAQTNTFSIATQKRHFDTMAITHFLFGKGRGKHFRERKLFYQKNFRVSKVGGHAHLGERVHKPVRTPARLSDARKTTLTRRLYASVAHTALHFSRQNRAFKFGDSVSYLCRLRSSFPCRLYY